MAIKLGKIGTRPTKEKKVSLTIEAYLAGQLDLYAQAYQETYGAEATQEEIILAVLGQFFATDPGFKKYVQEKSGTVKRRQSGQPKEPKVNAEATLKAHEKPFGAGDKAGESN